MEALVLLACALLRDLAPLQRHLRLSSAPLHLPGLCSLAGDGAHGGDGGGARWRVHGVWRAVEGGVGCTGVEGREGGEGPGVSVGCGEGNEGREGGRCEGDRCLQPVCNACDACTHGGTGSTGLECAVQQSGAAGMKEGAMARVGADRQHGHGSSPGFAIGLQGSPGGGSTGAAGGHGGEEKQGLGLMEGQQKEGGASCCAQESDAQLEHGSTPAACSQQQEQPSLAAASSHAWTEQAPSPLPARALPCDALLQWPLSGTAVSLLACLACGYQVSVRLQIS
ncbi:unnamed protein product [Closterium sp. NIES-53]